MAANVDRLKKQRPKEVEKKIGTSLQQIIQQFSFERVRILKMERELRAQPPSTR